MTLLNKLLFSLLLCLFWPTASLALENDSTAPIKVSADKAEFQQAKGSAIYTGNVYLQQGSIEIRADKMELIADQGVLKEAYVFGGSEDKQRALLKQKNEDGSWTEGQAEQIHIEQASGDIELKGNARLDDGNSTIKGPLIHYNSRQQTVEAQSDGDNSDRVEMIFKPAATE
ncbi:cell envelope biogenesis protein YhbN [gamma proteobacterium HTCC5015]|nr:cell envelope biogenesis protein YhbN [gamma proteobacterium HTCC5015]